jgi:toxin ParE1/3/4
VRSPCDSTLPLWKRPRLLSIGTRNEAGGLPDCFLDELDRAIDRIGRNPEQYPPHDLGTRRMVLRRFPFVIVFRKAAAAAEIIAIAHGRHRPAYWRESLG